jgi:hypothetical protein
MENKTIYWIRWIMVLPVSIITAFLSTFLLHLILYQTLTKISDHYPETPEKLLAPLFIAGTFVFSGYLIAPTKKFITATVFAVMWTITAIVLITIAIINNDSIIGILFGFIGCVSGWLLSLQKEKNNEKHNE